MSSDAFDLVVCGAGLVGLSIARAARRRHPGWRIAVLDKEAGPARHQSGRNSGVLHSGLYYRPGSEKARLCRIGRRATLDFARSRKIGVEVCGKVVVATTTKEEEALEALAIRAESNGVAFERLGPEALRAREPAVSGRAGLLIPEAGIVDYPAVAEALRAELESEGVIFFFGQRIRGFEEGAEARLHLESAVLKTALFVSAAGLHADRVARLCGLEPELRIVPFRGEYFDLRPESSSLCRHLIYPVPDPSFPFLGVHLTRRVTGGVECGPNAVLALAREGYRWRDISLRDLGETLGWRGFRRLARQHWRAGFAEIHRSASRKAFLRSLQRLIPSMKADDLAVGGAGVRAQAVRVDGSLCDDFEFLAGEGQLHVLNAPSPAATAAPAIGEEILRRLSG